MGRRMHGAHTGRPKQPSKVERVNGCPLHEEMAWSIEVGTTVGTEGQAADVRHIPLGDIRYRGDLYLWVAGVTHQRRGKEAQRCHRDA